MAPKNSWRLLISRRQRLWRLLIRLTAEMLRPAERPSRAATTLGALGACILAAVLLASSEGGCVQGSSVRAVRLPAMVRQLRLTLRGGDGMDLSAEEAAALLDSGTEPAVLVQTLSDYRQSEQVQLQGCRRIAAALTAVASNQTAKESLLSSFSEAGAAVALVESLRWHTTEGKAGADLAAAMCEALGTLLAGPPNHAPPGDEWWRNDASCSSAMRVASARAGALHLALDVVRAHSDAALEAADRAAPPVCAVAGALLVLERLMMEHENKLVFSETGALTQLVEQLKAFKQHARMVESIMAVLMNSACAHDDNKLAIAAAGAVGHVVEVMDAHALDPGVQARACGLFCNLAAEQTIEAEDERLQVRIASAGAVSRIAGAMEAHADDAAVQEEACAAFMNLARNNADNRNLIRAAGGEQLARKVLASNSPAGRVTSE